MPLYTSAEIKTRIEILDAKIAKAESAQSYDAGANLRLARGDLDAMYRERARLEKLYALAEGRETGSGLAQPVAYQRDA